ncbi:uncharacterized protein Dsimw501_GD23258 [Drosophila simulans]|uniref:Secreted protein n=1 Tax=Drosophila simulans TaxID=7240 RepID=A0A0J9QVB7_DROSI|nr:uncharacterized protein Dsimw501_GD23258 [Drosophila simulans]
MQVPKCLLLFFVTYCGAMDPPRRPPIGNNRSPILGNKQTSVAVAQPPCNNHTDPARRTTDQEEDQTYRRLEFALLQKGSEKEPHQERFDH